MEDKRKDTIDILEITRKILAKKKLYATALGIAFIVSSILIVSVPRYYTSEIKLAPEVENDLSSGALGNLASSFGMDLGTMSTSDAISPELYPELLETNDFIVTLFPMQVETFDKDLKTDYYNYLDRHQKSAWWNVPINWITSMFKDKDDKQNDNQKINPYQLTKRQSKIANKIIGDIKCSIDRKTSLITISVTDQDRKICATIADSIRIRLQNFITEYRTNKARTDVEYYKKLTSDAKKEYERARQLYSDFSDANTDVILQSIRSKQEDLENDMQLKYNNYTTYNTQLQMSLSKLRQRTPAFTLLKGASVPERPSGPKRVIFVLLMMFLTFIGVSIKVLLKQEK